MTGSAPNHLESLVGEWRSYLSDRSELDDDDIAELEDHLRAQVSEWVDVGLAPDEAFLIGVKRLGAINDISLEFAREYSARMWKQLTLTPAGAPEGRDMAAAVLLAIGAGLSIQLVQVLTESLALRNLSLLVLPFLAAYFGWSRHLNTRTWLTLGGLFAAAAVIGNLYAPTEGAVTQVLVALHLPIVVWLLVGYAFVAGDWRDHEKRMNFIRFSGEWFIYFVLLGLGGGVLIGLTMAVFSAVGLPADDIVLQWILPSGAAGAVVIAGWLVNSKQSVIENIAPVLTQIFTPLFTVAIVAFVVATLSGGQFVDVDRDVLIIFDLLLVIVLGLILYNVSARDPRRPPGFADMIQLTLLVSALSADLFMLTAMIGRISEFGFSANKVAALGENLVLLGNLGWAAVLSWSFTRRRGSFAAIERWQTSYVPIYGLWALVVIVVVPPLFGFA